MRIAVVSDIHANLTALDAVIADLRKTGRKSRSGTLNTTSKRRSGCSWAPMIRLPTRPLK
jgi:hypothetical protein